MAPLFSTDLWGVRGASRILVKDKGLKESLRVLKSLKGNLLPTYLVNGGDSDGRICNVSRLH